MAERKWTDAQKNAIEAKSGTVLVSAAAGSGKTSVLTERIVRKLTAEENSVKPDSLLVVTFTNAAAAEMRSRIYSGISAVMAKNPDRRSEFSSLLAVLGEMQVCTMDSFSMNLVKEHCHKLGIEADFGILEGGECTALKRKTAISVLERRFSECADTFLPLAKMFESGKNDARLIETVIKLSDFSMSEPEPQVWLQGLHGKFSDCEAGESVYGKYISRELLSDIDYCIFLSDTAIAEILTDEELAGKYMSVFEKENALIKKYRGCLEEASWDEKINLVASLYDAIKGTRIPAAPKGYGDNPVKLSAQAKRDAIKKVLGKASEYMSITEEENAQDTPLLRAIARELTLTVQEYNERLLETKKDMSAFDFSDISHFALELLYDSSASDGKTPLARELTEKYSEILIDEYQDTNRAQDTLFSCVSRDGKNMFFVGDAKQSIYRFRLASPEIFIEKCNEFPHYDTIAEKSKIVLGHNFRSRKGILDCVNFIFSRLMTPECGDIEYNEDERLNFPERDDYIPLTDVEAVILQADEDVSATEADYIARTIKEYISSGVTVNDGKGERRAVPSDFCILMRSPSKSAPVYISALEERDIPVSSDVNLNFFETPEIKTIMSYLRVLDNPVRDTDMLAVMLSPLFGFTPDDTARLRLAYPRTPSLYSAVIAAASEGDEKCKALYDSLSYFSRIAACYPVGELLREIYDNTAYLFVVNAMKDGENRKSNLLKLLARAEGAAENNSTLGGFVRYMDMLRDNGADISGSTGGSGVRIMSMHKSKGLEFPFVFVAGTCKIFNKTDLYSGLVINHNTGLGIKVREPENIKNYDTVSSLAVKMINSNELLSEELRVHYVALTRAKQKLFIVMAPKNRDKLIAETRNLLSGMNTVHPYIVKHSGDAARWLVSALMLHPDGVILRDSVFEKKREREDIHIELPSDDIVPEETAQITEKAEADADVIDAVRERASFRYKWEAVSHSRSKHTASSVDGERFDSVNFGKSVPAFMFSEAMSPADIGTATHRFLQFCDFDNCRASVEREISRLVKNGRLSEKQAECVDKASIDSFVNSEILARAEKSKGIFREKQFTMAKSVCELDSSIPSEFSEEKTVIIGKIDLLFVEDDGAVIVDYKTDNIKDISVLSGRYREQMKLYSEALKKSMDINVKECILYSLKLRDSISLEF